MRKSNAARMKRGRGRGGNHPVLGVDAQLLPRGTAELGPDIVAETGAEGIGPPRESQKRLWSAISILAIGTPSRSEVPPRRTPRPLRPEFVPACDIGSARGSGNDSGICKCAR